MCNSIELVSDVEFLKEFERRKSIGVRTTTKRSSYYDEIITEVSLIAISKEVEFKVSLIEI